MTHFTIPALNGYIPYFNEFRLNKGNLRIVTNDTIANKGIGNTRLSCKGIDSVDLA